MTTIPAALDRLWEADEEARMVRSDGGWQSWGRVRSLTERLDEVLTAAGCGAGGRVAVVLGNHTESIVALIAIMRGSRTLVTISPLQPVDRLSADIIASEAGYVIAPEALWSEGGFTKAVTEIGAAGWSVDGDAVTTQAQATRPAAGEAPGVAVEMLTSGTTGPPKRIPLTYRQLEASLSQALQRGNNDKPPWTGALSVITVPIVHIGGLWALLQVLVTARPFVLLDRFTVAGWHAAVRDHRPLLAALPPAAIRSVLEADIPREDLSSLRAVHAGASPVDPALVDEFHRRYGIPILILYGATEFVGTVAGWSLSDFTEHWKGKRGSVGRPLPGVRLRVVDGRLQIASDRAGGSADEWISTSDLAHLDDDGFLYIDGRADDVIMRGGFKVAPQAVVTALCRHQTVADAAVAGLPHPRLGQVPVAAVELRNNMSVTGDELREHCRSLLTPYEVPVEVVVVEELPRGAAMKVDRRRLIAMLPPAHDAENTGQQSTQ